jgi:aminoglycoside 6-adenylyltransferase
MVERGLDGLYDRGYKVVLDKSGVTGPTPAYTPHATARPSQGVRTLESEFSFEATQVAVYPSRGEL